MSSLPGSPEPGVRSLLDPQQPRTVAPRRDGVAIGALALIFSIIALCVAYSARVAPSTPSSVPDSLRVLAKRLDSLSGAVARDGIRRQIDADAVHAVDLHQENLQSIGDGFSVGELSVAAVARGTRVHGTLINREAVEHRPASFRFQTRGESTDVFVTRIPAGGSAYFTAFVPVVADSVRYGDLRYRNSTVSYRVPH
jgi:hypothetical protein